VVGGLVEEQDVGALEQEAREHAAHLPAAGQLADVAGLVAGRKAQAREDGERLVLAEEPLEVVDAIVDLGDVGGGVEQRVLGRTRAGQLLDLGLGGGEAQYLTTDLSYDYVRINADYRS
jgi:hypothetical protein